MQPQVAARYFHTTITKKYHRHTGSALGIKNNNSATLCYLSVYADAGGGGVCNDDDADDTDADGDKGNALMISTPPLPVF